MNISTWTAKERCMAAFWLLCATALAFTIYLKSYEAAMSDSLQSLGLLALLISWALNPKLFLQPLKETMSGPIKKTLVVGWLVFFAFQVASLLARHAV